MSYHYPTPVEISCKIVRWQGQPVRLVRIQNEPAGPSVFFSEGGLPEEDPNADALDHILAELLDTLPQDGIPTYILSHHFFPPKPDGLEDFPAHAYEDDTEGWNYYQLRTTFY